MTVVTRSAANAAVVVDDNAAAVDDASVEFLLLGSTMVNIKLTGSKKIRQRQFSSWFGIDSAMCSHVWEMIQSKGQPTVPKAKPIHLLWMLLFVKGYCKEHINAQIAKVDEKTFRKWSWIMIERVASLAPSVVSSLCSYQNFSSYVAI